jgi:hypothetical protein
LSRANDITAGTPGGGPAAEDLRLSLTLLEPIAYILQFAALLAGDAAITP